MIVIEVSNVAENRLNSQYLAPYWSLSKRLTAIAKHEALGLLWGTKLSHLFAYNSEVFLRALYYLRQSDQDWVNRYRITPSLIEETMRVPRISHALLNDALESRLHGPQRLVPLSKAREAGRAHGQIPPCVGRPR